MQNKKTPFRIMAFERGDIIEVYFDLPYHDKTETHPAVIVSNEEVYVLNLNHRGTQRVSQRTQKKNPRNPL